MLRLALAAVTAYFALHAVLLVSIVQHGNPNSDMISDTMFLTIFGFLAAMCIVMTAQFAYLTGRRA